MRARQRLLRALVADIIADVDDAVREVVLTIHWRGGQHSQLRMRKPKSGEHGCRTPEEALAVMRSMATRWSDEDIAATLNRMGIPTGQGKTWTAHRVSSLRRVHGIHAYRSAEKDGEWLTMSEAAAALGVDGDELETDFACTVQFSFSSVCRAIAATKYAPLRAGSRRRHGAASRAP